MSATSVFFIIGSSAAVEDGDDVGIHIKARAGTRYIVADDEVNVLLIQLFGRIFAQILRFGGKGDQHLTGALFAADHRGNVRIFHELQLHGFPIGLLDLLSGDVRRAVVRRSGSLNDDVLLPAKTLHRAIKILRALDKLAAHARRAFQCHRAGNQRDLRAAPGRSLRAAMAIS